MSENNTFKSGKPTWANACVGDNGSPSYVEYAEGFSESANLLLNVLIQDECRKYYADTFIYPICFNMRHSVELRLKGCVSSLQKIAALKGTSLKFDYLTSHDLNNIWAYIQSTANQIDHRYNKLLIKLDSYIKDIANIDPTGQTFRYPINLDSKKHLTEVSIINIIALKISFTKLAKLLEELHLFNCFLEEEYLLGTFTKKLSRAQLFLLASELPPKNKWNDMAFDKVKSAIKAKYSLSSNELSKSIKIIKAHHEMAILISAPVTIAGINSECFDLFFSEWTKLHGIEVLKKEASDNFGVGYFDRDFEKLTDYHLVKNNSLSILSVKLEPDVVSCLKALFEFGREIKYSEMYLQTYARLLTEQEELYQTDKGLYKSSIRHLLEKTSAIENIISSLYFLGHSELSEKLLKSICNPDDLEWFNNLRSKNHFIKPELWGYVQRFGVVPF